MSLNVIRDMNEFGVCVLDNFIGEERGKKVLEEVHNIHNAGYFKVSSTTRLIPLKELMFI
jgi:hypoxia-inducible factor prolyl hydroxylase